MIAIVCAAVAGYLFATKRRRPPSQQFSLYFCTIHQDYFKLPGTEPYAVCPTCFAKFESMERDFAS